MELTELCQELRNWFELKTYIGTFTITEGSISFSEDILLEGQYFRIVGSVFNDGVYKYPVNNLVDETFHGAVWAMAVPPSVIALLQEITDWEGEYGETVLSPYSSESFGGYSYTKATGNASSGAGNGSSDYRNVFANKLKRWRKI